MNKYVEKLKEATMNSAFLQVKDDLNATEIVWDPPKRKRSRYCAWIFIGLPAILFLTLGIYFLIVDFHAIMPHRANKDRIKIEVIKSQGNMKTTEEPVKAEKTWLELSHHHPTTVDEYYDTSSGDVRSTPETEFGDIGLEEDPDFVVKFGMVNLDDEEINGQNHMGHVISSDNETTQTLIILKNSDTGKKIYLKSSQIFHLPEGVVLKDEVWKEDVNEKDEEDGEDGTTVKTTTTNTASTTTAKPFVYSPTIPHPGPKRTSAVEETTMKYQDSNQDSRCFSTKIGFCEGIVPYDVVQLPELLGMKRYSDLTSILPYFQMIVDSGCSLRAREFICSVLEPECKPEGEKPAPPCKLNCKVVSDDCKDYILQGSPLSKIFDCSRYPDWDENGECVNFSKGRCNDEEFQCSDGSCIPSKWVCDGVHDCPGSRPSFDESNCQGCTENEFRCVMDGKCIPLHWKCDGQIDCIDHSDEMFC